MEYGRIVRESWSITVGTRSLWWLGAIAAAQAGVYAIVVGGLALPMAALPQLAASITATGARASVSSPGAAELILTAGRWLGSHLLPVAMGALLVLSAWLVLGVLDVAAQTGMVAQVNAVAEHRPASFGSGLLDGFRLWWRAVALFALAALPTMAYLLVMAIVVLLTVSLPLYRGQPPQPATAFAANLALSPLSAIVSLVSIPLGVLVQLALRFAVVDDVAWRPAFSSAWRLARANLAEIAVVYVVVMLVSFAAFLLFAFGAAVLAVIASALLLGAAAVATSGDSAATGQVALFGTAGLVGLLFVAFQGVMFVWQSSAWTLVWRDRTRPGSPGAGQEESTALRGSAT